MIDTKKAERAGSYYRVLPQIPRRQMVILIAGNYISKSDDFTGIRDANLRACTGEKSEMVGSRRSTDSLIC
ncbi:hypothetical protein [Ignatzschineria cameli]|uniref:hypothetical protein n=1 Tax=Ignatzschineria cameli TaxID=2182793 RepID=UPI001057D184|nr:hypothetical protein [Ignatzschineria cameli]